MIRKTLLLFVYCVLFVPLGWAQGKVQQEDLPTITSTDSASLHLEHTNRKKDFWLRLNAEYKKRSADSEAVKLAFLELRTNYLEYRGTNPNRMTLDEFFPKTRAFLALKPKDPFSIVWAYSILQYETTQLTPEENKKIEDAVSRLSKYSVQARFIGAATKYSICLDSVSYPRKHVIKAVNEFLDHTFALLETFSSSKPLERVLYAEAVEILAKRGLPKDEGLTIPQKMINRINKGKGNSKGKGKGRGKGKVKGKVKGKGKSPKLSPWLKSMLLGACHKEIAWDKRGRGYGSEVNKEGWKGFAEHLAIAAEHFKRAYEINPEFPEAATAMIEIARASETKVPKRVWFERATAAEFDYRPAYTTMLFSLSPRWGGSIDQMLEFGRQCAKTGRYDTSVPSILIYAVNSVRRDLDYDDEKLKPYDEVYPEIRRVCLSYEKAFQENGRWSFSSPNTLRCYEFAYSYAFKRYKDARAIYEKHNGDIYAGHVMSTFRVYEFAEVVATTFSMTENSGELVQSIANRMRLGRTCHLRSNAENEKLLQDIGVAQMSDVPETEEYLTAKQELVAKQLKFHEGDWVELNFTEDLRHWQVLGGEFKVESPNSIVGESSSEGGQYLVYLTSFPPPYEIELTVEHLASNSRVKFINSGIICGRQAGPSEELRTGRIFWINGLRGRMGIGTPYELASGIDTAKNKSKIKVNVFKGYHEFFLVGEEKSVMISDDPNFVPGRIALGAMLWHPINAKLRYKDFRIRKLNFKRPPRPGAEGEIEYYAERLKTTESFRFRLFHAVRLQLNNRPEEALQAFSVCQEKYPSEPVPFLRSSSILYRQKSYSESAKAARSALKNCVGPNVFYRSQALIALTQILGMCPDDSVRDGQAAFGYAKELLKGDEQHFTDQKLWSIAIAYAAIEDYETAIEYCQKCMAKVNDEKRRTHLKLTIERFEQKKPHYEE